MNEDIERGSEKGSGPTLATHRPAGDSSDIPELVAALWNSSEPQLLIDPQDGRIVDANDAAVRFYGWTHGVLCSFTIDRINTLPPAEIRARLAEATQRPRTRFVFPHRFADGRVRSVEVITGPVRIGERILLWSTLHDLSDIVHRSPEFETLAHRYQTLVENLPAVVYLEEADPPHRKIYVSPAAERLLGWAAHELQVDRATWYERFVAPEDRAWALAERERNDRTGEALRLMYRFRTGDGRTVWLRDEAVLIRDRLGHPWARHGLLTDVTSQKRLEARLQRELAFHNVLLGIASRLVTASSDEFENVVAATLADLGSFLAIDHLVLLECEGTDIVLLSRWQAPGIELSVRCLGRQAIPSLPSLQSLLERGQPVVVPRLEALDAGADDVRTFCTHLGLRSLLAVPLLAAGRLIGCLLAAQQRDERLWGEEELDLFTLVSQLYAASIQQRRAERAEAQHHAWLRATVLAAPDALLVLDANGIVRFASPAARTVLGLAPDQLVGRPLADLTTTPERVASWALDGLRPERANRIEVQFAHQPTRTVELSGVDLRSDRHIAGIVLSARDVTERKRAEQLLRERATRDQLTGLLSRFGFLEVLEALLHTTTAETIGILCCDLERFSALNDALSWEAGDAILRAVAERIRRVTGALAAARLEADRFAVALTAPDRTTLVRLAEELLHELSGWYEVGRDEVYARMRGGLACVEDGIDATTALRRAEIAFQVGKRAGQERLSVFDPVLYQASIERQFLERDLRRALEQGELQIHYQPVIAVSSGRLTSLEALVRWHHPDRGPISPAVFVPLAETTGLISQLTQWVLLQACRQLWAWSRAGLAPELSISVNLSPTDFLHVDVPQLVDDILQVTGLEPRRLTLELTESAMLDPAVSRERLERLRALGIAVLIDDFGAGYSSLGYLKQLPVSGLKIDRTLVADIDHDPASTAVVRSILELAGALELSVTAEGIESARQLAVLRELGCHYAQGFFVGRPAPPNAIHHLLRRGSTDHPYLDE